MKITLLILLSLWCFDLLWLLKHVLQCTHFWTLVLLFFGVDPIALVIVSLLLGRAWVCSCWDIHSRKLSPFECWLLFQARTLISKVTEEKNSAVEQNKKLQRELVWKIYKKMFYSLPACLYYSNLESFYISCQPNTAGRKKIIYLLRYFLFINLTSSHQSLYWNGDADVCFRCI